MEAKQRGADEAIILDMNGFITECAGDNLFMIKNNVLITSPHVGGLKGITREAILDISTFKSLEIYAVDIRDISVFEMYIADEVFVTGTAVELVPVIEIDGRKIGNGKPGKITLSLQEEFRKYINEEHNSIKVVK